MPATHVIAQEWTVDWQTIDGGGVLESESADQPWQLSARSGSGCVRLTDRFWILIVDPSDFLFMDRFEALIPPAPLRSSEEAEQEES